MQRSKDGKREGTTQRSISFIFASLLLSLFPFAAHAATVTFDPQSTTVGTTTPFEVGVDMDSVDPMNAFSLVLDIPASMKVVGYSDGNSVVNIWIDQPHMVDTTHLSMSGIVPGGYTGKGGRIVTIYLQAREAGPFMLALDPSSQAYQNSPTALREPLASKPLALVAIQGKDNIADAIPDTTPPEPFTPSLIRLPGLGSEQIAVAFATQDKGSGIARYEVAESWSRVSADDTDGLNGLSWHEAQSPYVLADQDLISYIYVRAVDGDGNQRLETILPQYPRPWYERTQGYILVALLACFALYALIFHKNKRRHTR